MIKSTDPITKPEKFGADEHEVSQLTERLRVSVDVKRSGVQRNTGNDAVVPAAPPADIR